MMMMVLVVEKGWKAVFSEHDTSTVQIHKSVTDPGIGNAGDDDFEDNDGNGGDDDAGDDDDDDDDLVCRPRKKYIPYTQIYFVTKLYHDEQPLNRYAMFLKFRYSDSLDNGL